MHVVDHLVRDPPIVLQDVVVLRSRGDGEFFGHGLLRCEKRVFESALDVQVCMCVFSWCCTTEWKGGR